MKRILITGANSYIGMYFENYIMQWSDDFCVDTVDMLEDTWREKDFSSYDTVFHVAGIAHSDNGKISKEKEKLYYKVNTDLTIETAKKAKKDGVKQFIFMSSVIVYGESAPIGKSKIITKDTPVSPANCYGDSKVQAEKGIIPLQEEHFNVVILRPPMIYGKGCKGNYPTLAKFAKKTPIFPKIENERSTLYVENLCEFIRLMIINNEKGIFFPQNRERFNTSEIVKMIADVNGRKIRLVKLFNPILRLMAKCIGIINKVFGNLCYDESLGKYHMPYCRYNLYQSIENTEDIKDEKPVL